MKILAIDPGGTTGFSSNCTEKPYWHIKFDNLEEFHDYLLTFVLYDVFVLERFDHRQKAKIDHAAIEQIGVVKFVAKQNKIELALQGSSVKSKKSFWDDKKLRFLGLINPHVHDAATHSLDALRHRLHYEERNGMFDMQRLRGLE